MSPEIISNLPPDASEVNQVPVRPEQGERGLPSWEDVKTKWGIEPGTVLHGRSKEGESTSLTIDSIDEAAQQVVVERFVLVDDGQGGKKREKVKQAFPLSRLQLEEQAGRIVGAESARAEAEVSEEAVEGDEDPGEEGIATVKSRAEEFGGLRQGESGKEGVLPSVTERDALAQLNEEGSSVIDVLQSVKSGNPALYQELDAIMTGQSKKANNIRDYLERRVLEQEDVAGAVDTEVVKRAEAFTEPERSEGASESLREAKERFLQQYEDKLREAVISRKLKIDGSAVDVEKILENARRTTFEADEARFNEIKEAAERQLGPFEEAVQTETAEEGRGELEDELLDLYSEKLDLEGLSLAERQEEMVALETQITNRNKSSEYLRKTLDALRKEKAEREAVLDTSVSAAEAAEKAAEGRALSEESGPETVLERTGETEESEVMTRAEEISRRLKSGESLDNIVEELKEADTTDPVFKQIQKSLELAELDRSSYSSKTEDVLLGLEILADRERRNIQKRKAAGETGTES